MLPQDLGIPPPRSQLRLKLRTKKNYAKLHLKSIHSNILSPFWFIFEVRTKSTECGEINVTRSIDVSIDFCNFLAKAFLWPRFGRSLAPHSSKATNIIRTLIAVFEKIQPINEKVPVVAKFIKSSNLPTKDELTEYCLELEQVEEQKQEQEQEQEQEDENRGYPLV